MLTVIFPMQAAQAFEAALSAKGSVAAAVSAALAVAEAALNRIDALEARVSTLEAEQKHLRSLATLRDPIKVFRGRIATRMGMGWDTLSAALSEESWYPDALQPATQRLVTVLREEGLSRAVWDDVTAVANKGIERFHQGRNLAPVLLLQEVRNGDLIPPELAPQQQSIEKMLKYLHNKRPTAQKKTH